MWLTLSMTMWLVAFLSVGAAMSAVTRNQVIAFVLAVAICFVFAVASNPIVNDFLAHNVPALGEFTRRIAVIDRGRKVADKALATSSPEEVTGLITGAIHVA